MTTPSLASSDDFSLTDFKEPVRILYVTANPDDTSRLPLKAELDAIRASLDKFLNKDDYILEQEWEVDPRHLLPRLLQVRPHILHFAGHGTSAAELLTTDNTAGHAIAVPPEPLADLLGHFSPPLRLVVLNACWSELQATTLTERTRIPFVIGMHALVGNKDAEFFASVLYSALANGRSVRNSFGMARAALSVAQLNGDAPRLVASTATPHASNEAHVLPDQYLHNLELNYLQELTKYIDLLGEQKPLNPRPLKPSVMVNEAELYLRIEQIEGDYSSQRHQKPILVSNVRERLLSVNRCVLVGDPGSGKTWTLWRLASDYIADYRNQAQGKRKLLPIWLPLNTYQSSGSFSQFIYEQTSLLTGYFDPLHMMDEVIFLCDGFNELSPERMRAVCDFLQDKPYFVVTCREDNYQQYFNSLASLEQLRLRPLTLHQIKALFFAHLPTLGNALWRRLHGNDQLLSAYDKIVTHASADGFWEGNRSLRSRLTPQEEDAWQSMLNEPTRLLKLCRNPFLASVVCAIYAQNRTLSGNIASLFGTFVRILYRKEGERFSQRGASDFPNVETFEQFLEITAKILQTSTATVLPRDQILEALCTYFDPTSTEALLQIAFATTLLEVSRTQRSSIGFSHQLLQEYFAARTLRRSLLSGEDASQFFSERWWEPGLWQVAFRLLGQMTQPLIPSEPNAPVQLTIQQVVQWVAPVNPEMVLEIYNSLEHGTELLGDSAKQVLLESALSKTDVQDYPHPAARASAYKTLGKLHTDPRSGVLLRHDGLPDVAWCRIEYGRYTYQNQPKTLPYTFYMSRYPVTSAQYGAFRNASDYEDSQWWAFLEKPSITLRELPIANLPFHDMSWWEAVAFTRWLNYHMQERASEVLQNSVLMPVDREVWEGIREGTLTICVPRDEEWEKCARGLRGLIYPWGHRYKSGRANIDETKTSATLQKQGEYNLQSPAPVGMYPRNVSPYGAMDMVGNVWEWTATPGDSRPKWDPDRVKVLHQWRIARGGSFRSHYQQANLLYQGKLDPRLRSMDKGVRLCASPNPYPLLS